MKRAQCSEQLRIVRCEPEIKPAFPEKNMSFLTSCKLLYHVYGETLEEMLGIFRMHCNSVTYAKPKESATLNQHLNGSVTELL